MLQRGHEARLKHMQGKVVRYPERMLPVIKGFSKIFFERVMKGWGCSSSDMHVF